MGRPWGGEEEAGTRKDSWVSAVRLYDRGWCHFGGRFQIISLEDDVWDTKAVA